MQHPWWGPSRTPSLRDAPRFACHAALRSCSGPRHENLHAYQVALEVAKWARTVKTDSDLKDQLRRATASVTLNIAESSRPNPKAGRNHLRIALGSAAEACAALDLIDHPEAAANQQKLRRIGAMLSKMGAR